MTDTTGSVITIGVFDGVHIGHQALIREVIRISGEQNLNSLVINFDTTTNCQILDKNQPCNLLLSQSSKVSKLQNLGVDQIISIELDQDFMNKTADEFLEYLLRECAMKVLVVGEDFAFGKGRIGDVNWLKLRSIEKGFELKIVKKVEVDGNIISSSFLRQLSPELRERYL